MLYLAKKDKRLCEIIERRGKITREVQPDIFVGIVESIVGQQISTKAQQTICKRIQNQIGQITPETICNTDLQALGISGRKSAYIKNIANEIIDNRLDINSLHNLSDSKIIERLTTLKGIGGWTAEMLRIFSLQRPDILSYSDLAIQRGLRMLYHHREITVPLFQKYKKRYSPYASIASFYLWEIANGAFPEMKDYAYPKK